MTPLKRKWVLAGAVAIATALADFGGQLASGAAANAPRSVVIGLAIGGFARAVGAFLASLAMPNADDGNG